MIWKPNVTVAAVIERDGKFLLIEEESEGMVVFNQPAGHWEPGETLVEASIREALEESACRFVNFSIAICRANPARCAHLKGAWSVTILAWRSTRQVKEKASAWAVSRAGPKTLGTSPRRIWLLTS